MRQQICKDCSGTTIEYDTAAGNGFCVQCGTVVEENTIVAEVTFGETAHGAAMVQGSYVGQGQTRARMNGPGGYRGTGESREQTLANARRKIRQVQAALRISEHTGDQAQRWYTLAVEHRFTKGRRSELVVAVCLYVACRMSNTSHMLIDFSDMLQVNVFVLGMTYLRLVQTLNIKLPLVDPAHYIHRFAALLEFGDETGKVATDAVRLVQRFRRDWMAAGRRPAGICGASLLLAARMNNFRRSVQEIVQVVKIADVTLKKRLEEFRRTASGGLTVTDFRRVWLEEEMDPPAFTHAKEREGKSAGVRIAVGGRKRKRKRGRSEGEGTGCDKAGLSGEDEEGGEDKARARRPSETPAVDSGLLNQGILAGMMVAVPESQQSPSPLFLPDIEDGPAYQDDKGDDKGGNEDDPASTDKDMDDLSLDPALANFSKPLSRSRGESLPPPPFPLLSPVSPLEETYTSFLTEEVSAFIENQQGSLLADALDAAEAQRRAAETVVDDELRGLDEAELDAMLLSEEEVQLKERIWVELNREYLEALAAKVIKEQSGEAGVAAKTRKRRKTGGGNKPRDASNAHGATAAESVRSFVTKSKRFSRKINYSAYDTLFGGARRAEKDEKEDGEDGKDDGELVAFDEKSDAEGMVLVEEGEGVGALSRSGRAVSDTRRRDAGGLEGSEDEMDADGEKDEDTWGVDGADAYEQEV